MGKLVRGLNDDDCTCNFIIDKPCPYHEPNPSNSKSEDTPEEVERPAVEKCIYCDQPLKQGLIRGMLHKCEAWKAEPPQDTTIHDVVNGTPKGQEAVQKAIDDSIKVQNEMSKKAQDTSLDEQLMEVMLYVRTTHEVEHNDNQWTREFVYSFDEAKAKINRLIVLAKLEGFDIAFDCHDYDRLRAYKEQLTKELGDSEAEKNSGTWSRV